MANSQNKDSKNKDSGWKILTFFGLRLLLVAIAIVGAIYVATKLLPSLFAQSTAMLLLSILIGAVLIVGAFAGVFFVYKSFQESKLRWKNLDGKQKKYKSNVVIPLAPEQQSVKKGLKNQTPKQEPTNETETNAVNNQTQNNQSNIDNTQRAIDFESLKNLDLINKLIEEFDTGVKVILEARLNNLRDDLNEMSKIISCISAGFINSIERINMLSGDTIYRIGKLLNLDLLFLSTIENLIDHGYSDFLNLNYSKQIINQKIISKEPFEAIFNIDGGHYFFVKGWYSEVERKYKFAIDDSITRVKKEDGKYENSGFLKNWIQYVFNPLKKLNEQRNQTADENNKIKLGAFFSSNKNKQLAEKECGVFSLEAAGFEYFKKLNLENGNYNSAFDLTNNIFFKDDGSFKNSENYGNYDKFIKERYLITMLLLRESIIKEFVEKKLRLPLGDDRYKNFLNEIREGMIGIHKSFLNENKNLDFNSNDFKNNLAKYGCEVFQLYVVKLEKIFGENFIEDIQDNTVKNFIKENSKSIDKAIPPNSQIDRISNPNLGFNPNDLPDVVI